MPNETDALDPIATLGLERHPEGGYYAETFRSELSVASSRHPGERRAGTAIYYLLERGNFSALHRVRSDEVWHHYRGAPVTLHWVDAAGVWFTRVLGKRLELGERPQLVVPAGTWQAAVVAASATEPWALCGCTVAPGFEFADFELADRDAMSREFPEHARLIAELTR